MPIAPKRQPTSSGRIGKTRVEASSSGVIMRAKASKYAAGASLPTAALVLLMLSVLQSEGGPNCECSHWGKERARTGKSDRVGFHLTVKVFHFNEIGYFA